MLVTYTSSDYKGALDISLPSWKAKLPGEKIVVYTDTPNFGTQLFTEPAGSWDHGNIRKIEACIKGMSEIENGEYLIFMDSDCFIVSDFRDIFKKYPKSDLFVTRMVTRADRPHAEKAINAGVLMFKKNKLTVQLLQDWLDLAHTHLKNNVRYSEQTAISDLAFQMFDGLRPGTVTILSERLYNMEHDEKDKFFEMIERYNPHVIHLKSKWWQDPSVTSHDSVRSRMTVSE